MPIARLLCLAVTLTACSVRGEVSSDGVEPTAGVTAVIANQTATDLELTFASEGEGHASEGGGALPACNVSTMAMPVFAGETWELVVIKPDALGPVELIRLSTDTRPDLVVPAGQARRIQIAIDNEEAVLEGNVVIAAEVADDNLGMVKIADCA